VFWSLYDQNGSSWVLQAEKLNRSLDLRFGPFQWDWLNFEILASQVQAINPILILTLIPLFTWVVYPFVEKFVKLTALRKIGIGFAFAAASFALIAITEHKIQAGLTPTVMWQFLAYLLLTAAEVMVSVTALEFAYTQAPPAMKSFVTSFYLLSISLGNFITALVNMLASNLTGTAYFWFFCGLMLATTIIYVFAAKRYKGKVYFQDQSQAAA
jgi:POT family proton-dependent oligopeptide transporter